MDAFRRLPDLRTFVPPPPLKQSRPRAVELTGAGRALATLAMLLFAGAIGAGVGLARLAHDEADDRRALVEIGVMTDGVVTRLWPNGDNRRKVQYGFTANGQQYEGDVKVSTERRRGLAVGSTIAVRYVPGDPTVNDLGSTPGSGMPPVLPFVVAAAIAACGGLCLLAIRGQRRLLSDGRAAPAVVTGHTQHSTSHGGKHRSMTYTFPLLSGTIATGKSGTSAKPPAIGSVICIVYDPDRPTRNMVYPFGLVTPHR